MEFNILDNGGAFSLFASGGTDALDTLTQSGETVFVTQAVFEEMTFVPEGATIRDSQIAVRDWVMSSSNVVVVDVPVTAEDAQRFLPRLQPGQNFDEGDISIMKFAEQRLGDGNSYHIITDNYKDFDDLPRILQEITGLNNEISVTPSTYGYLSELLFAGQIDIDQYKDLRDGLANSGRAGQVNSSLSLDDAELDTYIPPDVNVDYNTARKMAILTVVLKEAGFVGDALEFTSTVAEVSRLYQSGKPAEAEALMGSYVGGVLGGASGAFGGAFFAAAALAIIIPEPSSTAVGVVSLVGALAGAVGGGMAGEAFGQELLEGMQARLANGEALLIEDVLEIVRGADASCFGSETVISMWPIDPSIDRASDRYWDQNEVRDRVWEKPIGLLRQGDLVVSFDTEGNLVPGTVIQTFENKVKVLLNFFGTRVTPGHVYYRADSKKVNKFEPLIDILRDDGVIQKQDGSLIRAATNVPVGELRDGFVRSSTGTRNADGTLKEMDQGRIRLGTRFIVGDGVQRTSWAVADLIEYAGGVIGEDEMIRIGDGPPMAFHWEFGDTLPKPEDFVLEASGTTLEDIYRVAEWESQQPKMPAPMVLDGGPVQPLPHASLRVLTRNEPLDVVPGEPNDNQ